MIPIYKPFLNKYKKSAIKCIEDEWISNHGIYIDLASNKLSEILNIKYCILMNNGTAATQCLFKAIKFKYPNIKKIYIPNNVFVAPWNCGLMEFPNEIFAVMKMNNDTLNIDTSDEYLMSLDKNACIVIVHNLGNIINVPKIQRLRSDLIIIEDNCEGLFGKYENYFSGSKSLCSSISFYGNKTITTGEGGAFLTNDFDIYKFIKNIYSHGMSNLRYIHDNLGYNFRMTNIEAGFLFDQLNDYELILNMKKNIFKNYDILFDDLFKENKIYKFKSEKDIEISYWMYNIVIPSINYNDIEKFLEYKNIQIRPLFYDIHCHKHLKNIKNQFENKFCETISNFGLMLPSYPELTFEQQQFIFLSIKEFITK